jgi:hypothetical protein
MSHNYDECNASDPGQAGWPVPHGGPADRGCPIRRVGVLRDPEYLGWLRQWPCVACVKAGAPRPTETGLSPLWPRTAIVDPAHTINNGLASKGPDSSCIPLCRYHHDEMDGRLSIAITTKKQFAAKYGLDLAQESTAHYAQYLLMKEKSRSPLSRLQAGFERRTPGQGGA